MPVISFGENNLYRIFNANDNAVLNFFQKMTKKILGVPLVLFLGNLIMFPLRKPVWTVGKNKFNKISNLFQLNFNIFYSWKSDSYRGTN